MKDTINSLLVAIPIVILKDHLPLTLIVILTLGVMAGVTI